MNNRSKICLSCLRDLNPQIIYIKLKNIEGIGIYPYENKIKDILFLFKGCGDYQLKDAFIFHYKFLLKTIFFDYVIVPVPSFNEHNLKRGFNHVQEMFSCLSLPIINCLEKIEDIKQSSLKKDNRQEISKYLIINENHKKLINKKVLLVDDVLTTGSTLGACYELLKMAKIKSIFFVVMSYTCRERSQFEDEK